MKQPEITITPLRDSLLPAATAIWNEIVEEGNSFPGDAPLSPEEARLYFAEQTETNCVLVDGEPAGLYVLHPNNIGRCAHIANASYAVTGAHRGKGLGRRLVVHSLERARACGFHGLQFNAVVAVNHRAVALYRDLGFRELGRVPGGFRMKDGRFEDTFLFLNHWGG